MQNDFIKIRNKFEKFILNSDYYTQQISRHYRGAINAAPHICDFYKFIINELLANKTIKKMSFKNTAFNFLISKTDDDQADIEDFSNNVKSQTFIRNAIKKAIKCKICRGYLHGHSITVDHKVRKSAGGKGNINNAQLTHPYCNTTYKN